MLIYVDAILLTGRNPQFLSDVIYALNSKFAFKVLSDVHYFLGLKVCRTSTSLQLSQQKYVKDLLKKFGLESSKISKTLMKVVAILSKIESVVLADPSTHHNLIRAIQYYILTRHDIAFLVNKLCQFFHTLSMCTLSQFGF